MRTLALTLVCAALFAGCGQSTPSTELEQDFAPGFFSDETDMTAADAAGGETNTDLPHPDQIEALERQGLFQKMLQFPQTKWNECKDQVTGNYLTASCTSQRNISEILDGYLQNRLIDCVDAGLAAQGGGTTGFMHVTHAGITGDPNHSPKSLHSVNRAIDVKSIRVSLTDGVSREYTYSKLSNRPFYTALRKCWGKVVHDVNGCPYYEGVPMYTGSIGWENSDHGHHMHLSVPYCVTGAYGPGLWRR